MRGGQVRSGVENLGCSLFEPALGGIAWAVEGVSFRTVAQLGQGCPRITAGLRMETVSDSSYLETADS